MRPHGRASVEFALESGSDSPLLVLLSGIWSHTDVNLTAWDPATGDVAWVVVHAPTPSGSGSGGGGSPTAPLFPLYRRHLFIGGTLTGRFRGEFYGAASVANASAAAAGFALVQAAPADVNVGMPGLLWAATAATYPLYLSQVYILSPAHCFNQGGSTVVVVHSYTPDPAGGWTTATVASEAMTQCPRGGSCTYPAVVLVPPPIVDAHAG